MKLSNPVRPSYFLKQEHLLPALSCRRSTTNFSLLSTIHGIVPSFFSCSGPPVSACSRGGLHSRLRILRRTLKDIHQAKKSPRTCHSIWFDDTTGSASLFTAAFTNGTGRSPIYKAQDPALRNKGLSVRAIQKTDRVLPSQSGFIVINCVNVRFRIRPGRSGC